MKEISQLRVPIAFLLIGFILFLIGIADSLEISNTTVAVANPFLKTVTIFLGIIFLAVGGWLGWSELNMGTIQPLVDKQKSLGHYVLFWWRGEDDWAQEDWEAAGKFIAKYKAVAGFSLTDAKKSKRVTIIGATSVVDGKAEAQLKQAGCIIQRLNGSSCEATAELLDQLVQNGNDFEEGTRYK